MIVEGVNERRIIGCKPLSLIRIGEALIKGAAGCNDSRAKSLDIPYFDRGGGLRNVDGGAEA
jgi:hypothetical protein